VVNQVSVYLAHTTYQRFEDKDVVLAAVNQEGEALWFADDALKRDPEILSPEQ